jgi:hypothetical protein
MWKYFYNFSGQIAMPDFYPQEPGNPVRVDSPETGLVPGIRAILHGGLVNWSDNWNSIHVTN